MFNYNMTKKVLIIGLNYGIEPSIALSGRINIAVNARGVFIAEYGILEENITYLTDEWAPLTKDQILAAIQALVDESTSLEEIYVYYAGYGSGIRILKQIKYPEVDVPETIVPEFVIPEPIVSYNPSIVPEPPPTDNVVEPADNIVIEMLPSDTNTDLGSQPTDTQPTDLDTNPTDLDTNPTDLDTNPTDLDTNTTDLDTNTTDLESQPTGLEQTNVIEPNTINITAVEIPPPTYYYEFAPVYGQYDKLTKQIVGSDYEIIEQKDILELLGKSHCRTICVLDMCPFDNDSNIMWGTDTIGNVNIISFSESDVHSSGKRAMIHTITSHFYPDV